jgi:hypothetical protein
MSSLCSPLLSASDWRSWSPSPAPSPTLSKAVFLIPVLSAILLLSGCVRMQLTPPVLRSRTRPPRAPRPPLPKTTPPGTTYPGGITLRTLTVHCAGAPPSTAEKSDFRQALSQAFAAAFPRTNRSRPPLRVDIRYRYHTVVRRVLVLDIFHMITLGFFFVTPEKGASTVVVDLTATAPSNTEGHARSYRATLHVRAPYKSSFTPWFDHTIRQKYLNHAHTVAFRKIVAHLRWWLSRGIATRTPPTRPTPTRPTPPTPTPPSAPPTKAMARPSRPNGPPRPNAGEQPAPGEQLARRLAWYDLKLHLEGASKSVKRRWQGSTIVGSERVKVTERRTAVAKILKLVGGLSVGYSYGSVWARSNVRDESGARYTIASGRGVSHSVGISLFRPPKTSGLYFSPNVGFLWERFSIADVSGVAEQNALEGTTDIPVIATDPDQPDRPVLDLGESWRYRLIMTSLYLGLRAGGVMVWGRKTQFYLALEGGANLVEWRWMDVQWDRYQDRGHAFAGAGSFAGRLMLGVTLLPWHLTFFFQGAYEYFREFAYPEPVPFRGRMDWDPNLAVWQRPVQTAQSISLHALRFYCGVAVIY